jgi:hypothetical protein
VISAPLHRISPSAGRQTSLGNSRDLPPISPAASTSTSSGWILGFIRHVPACPVVAALYAVSVRRAGILPSASFRFRITPDTLAVRLMVPSIRAHRGLAPPSHCLTTTVKQTALARHAPCQAHTDGAEADRTGFSGPVLLSGWESFL